MRLTDTQAAIVEAIENDAVREVFRLTAKADECARIVSESETLAMKLRWTRNALGWLGLAELVLDEAGTAIARECGETG